MLTSNEIRETFLRYFEERGHRRVKSSSLVPKDDPTLLFTNAGMNQFKDVFLGKERREYSRATSSQKCMRVSGKHNDLETVGRTPRHHTFFEMLGNFSFGDYFKREAIGYAWELCTGVFGLDPELLIVTVFEDDDDAYNIWRDEIGVAESRIFRAGEDDNFWAMGETGPCGPCSELHFDLGQRIGDTTTPFGVESDRFVEIWNLVFMQYERSASGELIPLPRPSIDTGMGLERITAILQGVASNYDTDLFRPIIEEACRLTATSYRANPDDDVSLRILADHSRAAMFLIDDGVLPGNEGRGYVLRKILRRAIRHGRRLGREEPFLYTLTALVGELMSSAYPELLGSREHAAQVVKSEEERFSATLSQGLHLLEDVIHRVRESGADTIPGEELFRLYDTYGFPFDVAQEIAAEQGLAVDEEGFQKELERQRERARASWKGGDLQVAAVYRRLADQGIRSEFVGYTELTDVPARVVALIAGEELVDRLAAGETGEVVLDRTPFYAEAGGQVGDRGVIETAGARAEVIDTLSPVSGVRVHRVQVKQGEFRVGAEVVASVDIGRRLATMSNHTATHLLHAALREVLGEHVKQAGSLVAPERLRFDFTHFRPLTREEIRRIEERVNEQIRKNLQVSTEIKTLDEALSSGATALFGEKYDERVRVVSVPGFSCELCGGTHVGRTGDISLFKIVSEGSVASGIRRIEAVTGAAALQRFLEDEEAVQAVADRLRVGRERVVEAVERLQEEVRQAERELERLRRQLAERESRKAVEHARTVQGVKVVTCRTDVTDRVTMRRMAADMLQRLKSGVVVLGGSENGKVNLVAMVSPDLTAKLRADQLIRPVAEKVGGGGGGKPELAEAGGKNPERLEEALEFVYEVVDQVLEGSRQPT